jgi:hypothetical protein
VIAWGLNNDAVELEATPEAETEWVETVVARSGASAERAKSCTPGYYNREGQANAKARQGSFFFVALPNTPTSSRNREHRDHPRDSRSEASG